MLQELVRAAALVLLIEGILPFLSPRRFRASLLNLASMEDRWLRLLGLGGMVVGAALLRFMS